MFWGMANDVCNSKIGEHSSWKQLWVWDEAGLFTVEKKTILVDLLIYFTYA